MDFIIAVVLLLSLLLLSLLLVLILSSSVVLHFIIIIMIAVVTWPSSWTLLLLKGTYAPHAIVPPKNDGFGLCLTYTTQNHGTETKKNWIKKEKHIPWRKSLDTTFLPRLLVLLFFYPFCFCFLEGFCFLLSGVFCFAVGSGCSKSALRKRSLFYTSRSFMKKWEEAVFE